MVGGARGRLAGVVVVLLGLAGGHGASAEAFEPATLPQEASDLLQQFDRDERAADLAARRNATLRKNVLVAQLTRLAAHYERMGLQPAAAQLRTEIARLQAARPATPITPPERPALPIGRPAADANDGIPPAPGTLTEYRGRHGECVTFRVTGDASAAIWGTDVYTDDSPPATAAVHAGLVKVGETAVVTVRILPGRGDYVGSERNGVTSRLYGSYSGSYTFERGPAVAAPPPPTSPAEFRGQIGKTFTVDVVGAVNGPVWGSDIYTDDSDVATAAVHAGLVRPGERATLVVTILPGRTGYNGGGRNGVEARTYGPWTGSFMIDRVAPEGGPDVMRMYPLRERL